MGDFKVVTRFAPSPTGFMHVGNLRTAFYSYLLAKKHNGTFILRIEDTDKEREVKGATEHILKVLKWVGVNWDEGPDIGGPHAPYTQSERLDLYKKYAQTLIEKGLAYPDPYTEEEVEKLREKAELDKRPFLYREHRPEKFDVWDGTKPLRFKVSEIKSYKWNDLVFGDLSAGPEALDDFILIKSDGYPTYNFAHVIDDIEMGVTHIVRGQEFISSTPKFLSLYEALKIKPPFFVSLPHILGKDGNKKLGKRDGAKDVMEYGEEGYLPETMINFLVLLGWHPSDDKEIFSMEELKEVFEVERIQKSGAQWNDDKLDWMNKEYLKLLPPKKIEEEILKRLPTELQNKDLVPVIFERISKWGDVKKWVEEKRNITETKPDTINALMLNDYLNPLFDPVIIDARSLIPKDLEIKKVIEYLNTVKDLVKKNDWIKLVEKNDDNELWVFAGKEGRGKVLPPVRVALSGKDKSIDLFEIMKAIGQDATLRRIENAIKRLETPEKELNTETGNKIPTESHIFTIKK
ncbi:MAG: glutamate--tRNA ligase [Minisyncoccia bacterium]